MKTFQRIASTLDAIKNCRERGNTEWLEKHEETIERIMETAPSGSGIDAGTKLDRDASKRDKLVFSCGYHHMNEIGYYDGWTEHRITVSPSLLWEIDLKISGRDRNQIKDYLHEVYQTWLTEEEKR